MSHTFSRQELFDLVWSEPMSKLAGRYKISDVGLAKACRKANIPRPPRGYWAKLSAGKRVSLAILPPREPGMSDTLQIGAGRNYYPSLSEQEILDHDLSPPVFENSVSYVARPVVESINKVVRPRIPERAHYLIRKFLDADDVRREKQRNLSFPTSWGAPMFDDRFEKRRLRVLNAILIALGKAGMKSFIHGHDARGLFVEINDTGIPFSLDAPTQKHKSTHEALVSTRGSSEKLRLEISCCGSFSEVQTLWEDNDEGKIESHLTEIVKAIILCGEWRYRQILLNQHSWMLERRTRLITEIRERKEQAEEEERDRLAAIEKAKLDRLLGDAASHKQAMDIREFVAGVEERIEAEEISISAEDLIAWRLWALDQAERIDPVLSGSFLEGLNEVQSKDDNAS